MLFVTSAAFLGFWQGPCAIQWADAVLQQSRRWLLLRHQQREGKLNLQCLGESLFY